MGDFGDKRNAEGYYDPTPYQAIKNMIKPGEIWTLQKKDNTETEVLIVAFGDNIATILYLMDEHKDGCVECALKFVNPRMLNWCWGGYLGKRVKKLGDQEFDLILDGVEDVLDVVIEKKEVTPLVPELEAKDEELKALHCLCKELDSKAAKYIESYKLANNENEKLKIQLEMLKGMYSDLMEKFLQRV